VISGVIENGRVEFRQDGAVKAMRSSSALKNPVAVTSTLQLLSTIGDNFEIFFSRKVISNDDMRRLEGYAAWDYGITLAVDHPYFSAAPTL
jgi:hypothetical protein